jgi:hypothetical protein
LIQYLCKVKKHNRRLNTSTQKIPKMKFAHSILLASMLTFAVSTSAQITITASDLPQGGESYTIQTSLPDPSSDFTITGGGFDWDFSDLVSDSEAEVEFGAMGDAPFTAQLSFNNEWTNAEYLCDVFGPGDIDLAALETLGVELPVAISNLYSYLQMSNVSYNIVGISLGVEGLDLPVEYSDIDEVHPLPLNYMDEINSTSAFTVNIPEVFTYETSASRAGSVDGWGTLTLPGGATHEVLRVNTTITTHDIFSLSGSDPFELDRVSTVYSWVGDGGMPYLEVSVIFGTVFSVEYQGEATVIDTSGNGITAVIPNTFVPFPNPIAASEDIILSGASIDTKWELRDATGRVINTGFGNTISTTGLASGAYLVSDITLLHKGLRSRPSTVIIK